MVIFVFPVKIEFFAVSAPPATATWSVGGLTQRHRRSEREKRKPQALSETCQTKGRTRSSVSCLWGGKGPSESGFRCEKWRASAPDSCCFFSTADRPVARRT